jgi:hypothetical protein
MDHNKHDDDEYDERGKNREKQRKEKEAALSQS